MIAYEYSYFIQNSEQRNRWAMAGWQRGAVYDALEGAHPLLGIFLAAFSLGSFGSTALICRLIGLDIGFHVTSYTCILLAVAGVVTGVWRAVHANKLRQEILNDKDDVLLNRLIAQDKATKPASMEKGVELMPHKS
jgi:hypothetical protein